MAAIRPGLLTMFVTRVRLSARTCNAISTATFRRRFIRKWLRAAANVLIRQIGEVLFAEPALRLGRHRATERCADGLPIGPAHMQGLKNETGSPKLTSSHPASVLPQSPPVFGLSCPLPSQTILHCKSLLAYMCFYLRFPNSFLLHHPIYTTRFVSPFPERPIFLLLCSHRWLLS